jgi:Domain of unknown function (DUF4335)
MPLSNSDIRRYTPPTCTLEVLAQNSPLSRWTGKSVVKLQNFELRFDDPRLPENDRIEIRGDREQLEALCAVVTNYVQNVLQESPDNFWETFSAQKESSNISDTPSLQESDNSLPSKTKLNTPVVPFPDREIRLEPNNHLTHKLFLGSLANPTSGSFVKLSTLQLFDLATALDEYSNDIMALPTPQQTRKSVSRLPQWAPVAAVLVLAASMTPLTLQFAERMRQQRSGTQTSAAKQDQVALQPKPGTGQGIPQPLLTPDTLPPIPNLGTPLPVPNSGLPGVPPQAPGAATLPGTPGTPGMPGANLTQPGTTTATKPLSPGTNSTLPLGSPQFGAGVTPGTGSINIPSTKPGVNIPSIGGSPGAVASNRGLNSKLPIAPEPIVIPPPPNPNIAASTADRRGNQTSSIKGVPPASTIPSLENIPPASTAIPPIAGASSVSPGNIATQPLSPGKTSPTARRDDLIAKIREGRNPVLPADSANRSSSNRTSNRNRASGSGSPQITEAKEFLRKKWQPPSGLKETLEYSILVDVDGSIQRIEPLNRAARTNLDNTGLPLIGEAFISPNRNGQSVRIRAVLRPDGKVQTFPESD